MHTYAYLYLYLYLYLIHNICVCVVYTFVVCAFSPFLEHRNSAKNEEQFSGSFVFGPLKLLTRVRQFVSSFKSSLEEV